MKFRNYTIYIVGLLLVACSPTYTLQSYNDEVIGIQAGVDSTILAIITPYQVRIEDHAKKNLVRIPIYKGTIPHEQEAKFKGASVLIKPASHGTGIKAGGAMRAVLESVGVKDILAKSKGSANPHNVVKATLIALLELRDPRTVAMQRGIKMDKVFNG